MTSGRTVEQLDLFYRVNFSDDKGKAPDYSPELLNWVAVRCMRAQPIAPAREWLARQAASTLAVRPLVEFLKWVRLAAVEALLGEDGTALAAKALALWPSVAAEAMFDTAAAVATQAGIAAAMFVGDDAAMASLRRRRLEMPSFEDWEPSCFELLYSSSIHATSDKLDSLATSAVRVCVPTMFAYQLDSIAPVLLALAAHARRNNVPVASLLHRPVATLDREVFVDADTPRLSIGKPKTRVVNESGRPTLEISVKVDGDGSLTTGTHALEPFTSNLVYLVSKAARRIDRDRSMAEALSAPNGGIRGVLRLPSAVGLDEEESHGYARRMRAAVEHARGCLEGVTAERVEFVVERD